MNEIYLVTLYLATGAIPQEIKRWPRYFKLLKNGD